MIMNILDCNPSCDIIWMNENWEGVFVLVEWCPVCHSNVIPIILSVPVMNVCHLKLNDRLERENWTIQPTY